MKNFWETKDLHLFYRILIVCKFNKFTFYHLHWRRFVVRYINRVNSIEALETQFVAYFITNRIQWMNQILSRPCKELMKIVRFRTLIKQLYLKLVSCDCFSVRLNWLFCNFSFYRQWSLFFLKSWQIQTHSFNLSIQTC